MRRFAALLVHVLAAVVVLSPAAAAPAARTAGSLSNAYTVVQMNLCLSGHASCYTRASHRSALDEATDHLLDHDADAVTLNEVCSGDAARLARRAGYDLRFAEVLYRGTPIACIDPAGRGVFGLAVLTKDEITASSHHAFAIQAPGAEERRWLCATTARGVTVCTAHLSTRGSAEARAANDAQCLELRGVLQRRDAAGTTVFGGDVNRTRPCRATEMWVRADTGASQAPGIQQIYGSRSLTRPVARVSAATYTDHDFLLAMGRLSPRTVSARH